MSYRYPLEFNAYKLKTEREALQLSKRELAKRAGMSRAAIQTLEKGLQSNVLLSTVNQLAKILDLNPLELLR